MSTSLCSWERRLWGKRTCSLVSCFIPAVAEGGRGEPEAPQIKKKKKEGGEEREGARLGSKTALSALVKRPNKGKGGGCCLEYIPVYCA